MSLPCNKRSKVIISFIISNFFLLSTLLLSTLLLSFLLLSSLLLSTLLLSNLLLSTLLLLSYFLLSYFSTLIVSTLLFSTLLSTLARTISSISSPYTRNSPTFYTLTFRFRLQLTCFQIFRFLLFNTLSVVWPFCALPLLLSPSIPSLLFPPSSHFLLLSLSPTPNLTSPTPSSLSPTRHSLCD
jgi:hypothetical protein